MTQRDIGVGYNDWEDFITEDMNAHDPVKNEVLPDRQRKILIGVSGKIGSGKDTIAGIIANAIGSIEIRKFAGPLKQIASLITGVPVENFEDQEFKKQYAGDDWKMTYREILQKLGTDAMRDGLHENVWVNASFAKPHNGVLVFTDVRFPNEAEAIKSRGGTLIRVERNSGNNIGIDHPSETSLDDYAGFDYRIDNSGSLDDLEAFVRKIVSEVYGR